MFSRYYQSELSYLRELGKEFAEANPSLAGLFAERGGDPDVERLLEGFAFLTARIRERIDDAVPEVIDAVAQLAIPQLARPIPACSVVELSPGASFRAVHTVDAGAELGAGPVDGTVCQFRTTAPLDLLPLQLVKTVLDESKEAQPRIRLLFRSRASGAPWPEHGRLRLFLHGPLGLISTVFLWLNQHLRSIDFVADQMEHQIPVDGLKPVGLSPDFQLLPWPENGPDGLRLMVEYFTLASKLLFVDVAGLERVSEEAQGDTFELIFTFDRPPQLPERLDEDIFRLNCVPVVNLFEISADPIMRNERVHEHLLRAAGPNPRHMEVYSVDAVTGLGTGQRERRQFTPFFDFAHLEEQAPDRAFYAIRRTPSPIDQGTDTYLAVRSPGEDGLVLEEEVLSIDLTCTNRSLPAELRVGDISQPTAASPTVAPFANITEVTRPARPPVGGEMHWHLVSHLALNAHSIASAEALQALLHHYNLHGETDRPLARANERRIESIRSVTSEPELSIIERVPMRGFHSVVEIEEGGFASLGDAYLFGCALDWLFATEVPVNSYHRLTMMVHPSGAEFTWQPTTGTQQAF